MRAVVARWGVRVDNTGRTEVLRIRTGRRIRQPSLGHWELRSHLRDILGFEFLSRSQALQIVGPFLHHPPPLREEGRNEDLDSGCPAQPGFD